MYSLRVFFLLFCYCFLASTNLTAQQGSFSPLDQLCQKKKLGRNDPKSNDIEGRNGDPCADNNVIVQVPVLCPGLGSTSLTATTSGFRPPVRVRWSTGDTTVTINNVTPGPYRVVVTGADGCVKEFSFDVDPVAPLQVGVTVTNTSEFGASDGSAIATAAGGSGNVSYAWSNGLSGPSTGSVLAEGDYTVTATDAGGCQVATATAFVRNNFTDRPPPPIINAGPDQTVCLGTTLRLGADQVARDGTTPFSYTWTGPFPVSEASAANPTLLLPSAGVFSYTVSVTDGLGDIYTDVVVITANEIPEVSLEHGTNDACTDDQPITLTGTPTGGTFTGTGITGDQFDPFAAGPGSHLIIYSYTSPGGCTELATSTIVVSPSVSPDWALPVEPIFPCTTPLDLNFGILGTPGGVFFGELINDNGFLEPGLAPVPGDYSTTYAVGQGGCLRSQVMTVTVEPQPVVSTTPGIINPCEAPLALEGLLTGGPVADGAFSGGPFVSPEGLFNPDGLLPGIYPVYYTYGAEACRTVVDIPVTVQPVDLQAGFSVQVQGNILEITDESLNALNVTYDFGDGSTSTDPNAVHTYALSGLYEVCQTVTAPCGIDIFCQPVSVVPTNDFVQLEVKVLLMGNFDPLGGLMSDNLWQMDLLPPEPGLAGLGLSYQHVLNLAPTMLDPGQFSANGPGAPVDYAFLELRFADDPSVKVASMNTVITRQGHLLMLDGQTPLFAGVEPGDYFVVVRHRNHLPVMTDQPVPLQQQPVPIDFSNPGQAAFGQDARYLNNGQAFLWAGDADFNNQVIYAGSGTDVNSLSTVVFLNPANNPGFSPSLPLTGYHPADLNLDGQVIYAGSGSDVNLISTSVFLNPGNLGLFSPSLPLTGQVPAEQDR